MTKIKTPIVGTEPPAPYVEPIVKTAAELAEEKRLADEAEAERLRLAALENTDEGTEITIIENEVETKYSLDTDGNAVLDGKIIYTKQQLEDLSKEPTVEDVTIDLLEKASGIEILDETGKKVEYELTLDSLAKRESDIKQLGKKEGIQLGVTEFFKANPELYDAFVYHQTYGTFEGFTDHVDYTKVTLDPTNETQLFDIIYKAELQKGNTPERAKRLAELSKNDKTLLPDATEASKYLATLQTNEVETKQKLRQKEIEDAIQEENNYYGIAYKDNKEVVLNVKDSIYDLVVTRGVIGELSIPTDGLKIKDKDNKVRVVTRKEIFDYISKPVQEVNGTYYTQAMIDEINRTNNKAELVLTYVKNLLGNDISQLTKTAIHKDRIINIKQNTGQPNKVVIKQAGGSGPIKVKTPI